MNKPCEHCSKADDRDGYIKCDNPCQNAKMCLENDKKLAKMIAEWEKVEVEQ